jgi:hypothetical protein
MPDSPDVTTTTDQVKINPLAPIGVMVGLFVCIFRAYVWEHGRMDAEGVGYAFGGIALAFLAAYVFAGRKKVRNRNRFSAIFCGFGLFQLLLEFSSRH